MERSSSWYTSEPRSRVMCFCNVEAPLVTSWTEDNSRKLFMVVVTDRKLCNYFEWHDLVVNSCQKRMIVALMKKVDELNLREKDLQTKINDMKMKGKFLGIGLVFSWVCVCLLVFLLCCRLDDTNDTSKPTKPETGETPAIRVQKGEETKRRGG
ncbi:hypothetical protein GmHk_U059565 [Glycine max]|nr:hypothetical protein GmHk_U059565 [Glycine max]